MDLRTGTSGVNNAGNSGFYMGMALNGSGAIQSHVLFLRYPVWLCQTVDPDPSRGPGIHPVRRVLPRKPPPALRMQTEGFRRLSRLLGRKDLGRCQRPGLNDSANDGFGHHHPP